jgi:hypothetical protein
MEEQIFDDNIFETHKALIHAGTEFCPSVGMGGRTWLHSIMFDLEVFDYLRYRVQLYFLVLRMILKSSG